MTVPNRINHSIIKIIIFTGFTLLVATLLACTPGTAGLSVFAAAGAKLPLDEICHQYEMKTNDVIDISYSGGGESLNQMVLTGSGDIYLAPEQYFMDAAESQQAILGNTRQTIAHMIPVIATAEGNPQNIRSLSDLAAPGIRIGVTRAETTLLGRYTPEIFEKAGLSQEISRNILTEVGRPDNLLTLLMMNQIDACITWHFYGLQAPDDMDILFLPPEQLTGIGEMQVAVSAYCQDQPSAEAFINFLTSPEGQAIFKDFGYITNAEEAGKYWW